MAVSKTMFPPPTLFHAPDVSGDKAEDAKTDTSVSSRRSEALRSFFPQLSVWLNNRIHFSRMRDVERYLAQATDLVDLEHRIAKIERNALWH